MESVWTLEGSIWVVAPAPGWVLCVQEGGRVIHPVKVSTKPYWADLTAVRFLFARRVLPFRMKQGSKRAGE